MHNLTIRFVRRIRPYLDRNLDRARILWTDSKTGQRAWPLGRESVVGVTRFELVTSSVSERPYGASASCPCMPERAGRAGERANPQSARYHSVTRAPGLACIPRALAGGALPRAKYPAFAAFIALPQAQSKRAADWQLRLPGLPDCSHRASLPRALHRRSPASSRCSRCSPRFRPPVPRAPRA